MVADELARYRIAPLAGLPPFAGGAVGLFGYDLVRTAEPSVGAANQDDLGVPDMALMLSDVLLAFDHLKHEVTVLANVFVEEDVERRVQGRRGGDRGGPRAARGPVPLAGAGTANGARVEVEHRLRGLRRGGRAREGVHPRRRRLPGGAEPALERRVPGRRLLDLPRPAGGQPQPLHVLPRLRGLPHRGRLAGVAREGQRAGAPSSARSPAPGRARRPPRRTCSGRARCSRTRRSVRST